MSLYNSVKIFYKFFKGEFDLIPLNDQILVYNMWEVSVYDYNASRRNIFFTVYW